MATKLQQPPRTRGAGGGRTLMLLGLVLALIAGALVFTEALSVQKPQEVHVVVATKDLPKGTILTLEDATTPKAQIKQVFQEKRVVITDAPPNYFPYVSQDALEKKLVNFVVLNTILNGDILRIDDPRLIPLGTGSANSLTNLNPPQLGKGLVLIHLTIKNDLGLQAGDRVDMVYTLNVTSPQKPNANGQQQQAVQSANAISQTTFQNVYIYAVDTPAKGDLLVTMNHQDGIQLVNMMAQSVAQVTLVLRSQADFNGTRYSTTPVDLGYIIDKYKIGPLRSLDRLIAPQ